jgi:hypothetical protein
MSVHLIDLDTGCRVWHGHRIDHTLGSRLCVNPDHLEPVTPLENSSRSRRKRHEN